MKEQKYFLYGGLIIIICILGYMIYTKSSAPAWFYGSDLDGIKTHCTGTEKIWETSQAGAPRYCIDLIYEARPQTCAEAFPGIYTDLVYTCNVGGDCLLSNSQACPHIGAKCMPNPTLGYSDSLCKNAFIYNSDYYCEDEDLEYCDGEECLNNLCVTYSCVDSDGGETFNVVGTTKVYRAAAIYKTHIDMCADYDDYILLEGSCNAPHILPFIEHDCYPNKCQSGKCSNTCVPTDVLICDGTKSVNSCGAIVTDCSPLNCVAGQCSTGGCSNDSDCNDQNLCTTDVCNLGTGKCLNTQKTCSAGQYCDLTTGLCKLGLNLTCTKAADCQYARGYNVSCVNNNCIYVPINVTNCRAYQEPKDGNCGFSIKKLFTSEGIKEFSKDYQTELIIAIVVVVIVVLIFVLRGSKGNDTIF